MNIDQIVAAHQQDIRHFVESGQLTDALYETLFGFYGDEMPYGIAKARTGDPVQWITQKFAMYFSTSHRVMVTLCD